MKWLYMIRLAIRSVLRNRMRSLLTMLGIVIGVSAVIALVSVGKGTQASIAQDIASLGTNLIMVRPGASKRGGVSRGSGSLDTLTVKDVEAIRKGAPLVGAVSAVVNAQAQVVAGSNNWSTSVQGVDTSYMEIKSMGIESGRFFTDSEAATSSKVAVLGRTVADELFGAGEPVGERIRIANVPFLVVGILESKGESGMGQDQDDVILAPSTTVMFRLGDGKTVHDIVASAVSEEDVDGATESMSVILRESHRLADDAEDDFRIRTQSEIVERASSITGTLIMLLSAIAAVSLLVGGIGIMNIMLVSVTERTREIGIRLAIGARASDVLAQFLIESIILCLMGGIGGILLGLGLGRLLANMMGVDVVIDPQIVLGAFLFSGAVGIFFGYYPAYKASRLDPIVALHHE